MNDFFCLLFEPKQMESTKTQVLFKVFGYHICTSTEFLAKKNIQDASDQKKRKYMCILYVCSLQSAIMVLLKEVFNYSGI